MYPVLDDHLCHKIEKHFLDSHTRKKTKKRKQKKEDPHKRLIARMRVFLLNIKSINAEYKQKCIDGLTQHCLTAHELRMLRVIVGPIIYNGNRLNEITTKFRFFYSALDSVSYRTYASRGKEPNFASKVFTITMQYSVSVSLDVLELIDRVNKKEETYSTHGEMLDMTFNIMPLLNLFWSLFLN
jgi:hypothetical protein